jgi:hypothetical protein
MHTLKATASSSLGLPAESYIYSIAASAPGSFAAISSDDSLRVFDAANLERVSVISRKTHDGVSALRSYTGDSQLLVTGGREGSVKVWDVRAGNAVVEMETGESVSFSIVFFCFLPLLGFELLYPEGLLARSVNRAGLSGVGEFLRHGCKDGPGQCCKCFFLGCTWADCRV